MAEADELSKAAKKRAAKKARDENFEKENPPAPPAPEPKAKAKAEPKGKAKPEPPAPEPKAKSKAKAAPAPAPEPEPKAAAKAKAKAGAAAPKAGAAAPKAAAVAPKAAAAPKAEAAPEPKQAAKAKGQPKQSAKAKAAPKEEEEQKQVKTEVIQPYEVDDGKSGGWEQATGLSKKMDKRAQKAQEVLGVKNQKAVPGYAPDQPTIPGMGPLTVNKAEINAVLARAAAAGKAARAAVEAESSQEKQKESNLSTATVMVPEAKIGAVIGPKGGTIKLIQEKTGVTRIDTSDGVFTITGQPEAVALAEHAIKEIIQKGYCSMAFEDFKEEGVTVHPSCFPDLIGKGGVTIKAIKSEIGVEVSIPEVPKNAPAGKKFKVTLAGKNENVAKATEVVNHIATYGYHELTHPGFSHAEMEVPQWAYSFLIGKAGSELRHIQNNYKVKVNIPREHSACQNVVVVGESKDVERTKLYIEKLLWNAENQTKTREKDGAIDVWGKEEEEEDWMKAYMYKR